MGRFLAGLIMGALGALVGAVAAALWSPLWGSSAYLPFISMGFVGGFLGATLSNRSK